MRRESRQLGEKVELFLLGASVTEPSVPVTFYKAFDGDFFFQVFLSGSWAFILVLATGLFCLLV